MTRGKDHQPPSPEDKKCPKHIREHWTKRALEIAIFIAAATAAFFTARQAYLENKQLRVGRETLWVAQDQERRQLRAYVGFTPGDVKYFGTTDQYIVVTRKNYGQTPAYALEFSYGGSEIIPYGSPVSGFNVENCTPTPDSKHLPTLFPGAIGTNKIKKDYTAQRDMLDTVRANDSLAGDGGYVLIYFGTICYTDSFGSGHYTNFCYEFHGKAMTAADAEACRGRNDSN